MRYRTKPVRAESLHIEIASGAQIQRWAQKRLPNGSFVGEVTETETVRHKNLKPIMNGLFCERIFGPVKSYVCGCGKNQKSVLDKRRKIRPPQYKTYCPDCEVEITSSKKRRYRLGYIKLHSLVVHSWFYNLRHQNPLAVLLETENTTLLELFVYCLVEFVTLRLPSTKESVFWYTKNQHRGHQIAYFSLHLLSYCRERFSFKYQTEGLINKYQLPGLQMKKLKTCLIKLTAQQTANQRVLYATESSGNISSNLSLWPTPPEPMANPPGAYGQSTRGLWPTGPRPMANQPEVGLGINQTFFSNFSIYKVEKGCFKLDNTFLYSTFNYWSLNSKCFLTFFKNYFIWSTRNQKWTIRFIFVSCFDKKEKYQKPELFLQDGQKRNRQPNNLIAKSVFLQKIGFDFPISQNRLFFQTYQQKDCSYLQFSRSIETSFVQERLARLISIKFVVNWVKLYGSGTLLNQIAIYTTYWHKTFITNRLPMEGIIALISIGGHEIVKKLFNIAITVPLLDRNKNKILLTSNKNCFQLRIKNLKTKKRIFQTAEDRLFWSLFIEKQPYFVSLLYDFSIKFEPETRDWQTKDRTFLKITPFRVWSATFIPLFGYLMKQHREFFYAQPVAPIIKYDISDNFQNNFLQTADDRYSVPVGFMANRPEVGLNLLKKINSFFPLKKKIALLQNNKQSTSPFLLVCQKRVVQTPFNSFFSRLERSQYCKPYPFLITPPSLVKDSISLPNWKTTNKIKLQHSSILYFQTSQSKLVYNHFHLLNQVVGKKQLSQHTWLKAFIMINGNFCFYKDQNPTYFICSQLANHSAFINLLYSGIGQTFRGKNFSSQIFFQTQLDTKEFSPNQKIPIDFSFYQLVKEKLIATKLQKVFFMKKKLSLNTKFLPSYYAILLQKQLFQMSLLFFWKIVFVGSTFCLLNLSLNSHKMVYDKGWLLLKRDSFLKKVKKQIFVHYGPCSIIKRKSFPFVKTSLFFASIKIVDNPIQRKKCNGVKSVVQRQTFFANQNVLNAKINQRTSIWQYAVLAFFSLFKHRLTDCSFLLINLLKNLLKKKLRLIKSPVLSSNNQRLLFAQKSNLIKLYFSNHSILNYLVKSSYKWLSFDIKRAYASSPRDWVTAKNVLSVARPFQPSFWLCLNSLVKSGQFYCYNLTCNKPNQVDNVGYKSFILNKQQQVTFLFALEPIFFFIDQKVLLTNNFLRSKYWPCKKQTVQLIKTPFFKEILYFPAQPLSFFSNVCSSLFFQLKGLCKSKSVVFIDRELFQVTHSKQGNMSDLMVTFLIQSVISRKASFLRLKFHSFPSKLNNFIFDEYNKTLETTGPQAFLFLTSHYYTFKKGDRLRSFLISARKKGPKLVKKIEYFQNITSNEKREKKQLKKILKKEVAEYQDLKYKIKIFSTSVNGMSHFSIGHNWPNMFLSAIPVLPPTLRPIITIQDQVAVSDVNHLYKRVLHRNDRFFRTLNFAFSQQVLQEAVDSLIGKKSKLNIETSVGLNYNQQPLKSLSDVLKGKKGRFRQNLLGKRVDYSGRSVIVVGPTLKVYECGLPREMALELFQPFLIREVLRLGKIKTIVEAKRFLKRREGPVWILLKHLLNKQPVFLNRAPTLHRLGIQAFQAKLVDGRALLLHPLVCAAFNADFDGDQMAVHIPLSTEACAESWGLMWSPFQLLSPANGQPSILPTQDMVLGCYYLTAATYQKLYTDLLLIPKNSSPLCLTDKKNPTKVANIFTNLGGAIYQYEQGFSSIHQNIWIFTNNSIESNPFSEEIVEEIRVSSYGATVEFYFNLQCRFDCKGKNRIKAVRTTPGRALFNRSLSF